MSVFKFKEFSIIQEKSAMKVGTDGVLLGCWVSCEKANNILDVGCGTGLITLMLGQRILIGNVTGIDIDKIASQEAQLNISNSDWKEKIEKHDAIFFGAVGMPERYPDHITLWGSLIKFRREFDQYINLRPVKLFPGINPPLANKKPGDIDMIIVRENTEGEYSSVGGKMYEGTEREIVIQETIMSKHGIDRVQKFAFELAKSRKRKKLTSATKSNGISITMPYWDERFNENKKNYTDIETDQFHIDILVARFVLNPEWFDVVVASNLFGDILSDLGPAVVGGMGIAPGANINPEKEFPSMFEPVHGSAPDIAGKNLANPIACIWTAAMMLDHLGETEGAKLMVNAIERITYHGEILTRDLGGKSDTQEVTQAVIKQIKYF